MTKGWRLTMQKRSIDWFREAIRGKAASKVTVAGGPVGTFLIAHARLDLLFKTAVITGDGVTVSDDQFTFCSHALHRMIYPLGGLKPLSCCYACRYEDIASVYEAEDGQAVILLKDPLAHDDAG